MNLNNLNFCDTPETVAGWMVSVIPRVWFAYDDAGTFTFNWNDNGSITVGDGDEGVALTFTPLEFLKKHIELIWLSKIEGYRHDWIDFAFKSHGADPDEYDDNTIDAVFQTMLYGKVVYG